MRREGGVVDVRVGRWNGSGLREAGWAIVWLRWILQQGGEVDRTLGNQMSIEGLQPITLGVRSKWYSTFRVVPASNAYCSYQAFKF